MDERLTERNKSGGIRVCNLHAALEKLAALERMERERERKRQERRERAKLVEGQCGMFVEV